MCGNKFALHSSLVWHMIIHNKDKEHKCDTCGRAFLRRGDLIKHHRTHTGIKKFKCDSCDKTFSSSSTLSVHKLLHTEVKQYQCGICKKKFLRRTGLNQHAFVHMTARNFQCEVCGKAYVRKSELAKHTESHAGIKNFQCGICQRLYRHKASLKSHIKRYHEGVGTIIRHHENAMTVENVVVSKTYGKSGNASNVSKHSKELPLHSYRPAIATGTGSKKCKRNIDIPTTDVSCYASAGNDSENNSGINSEKQPTDHRAKNEYCKKLMRQAVPRNIRFDISYPISDDDLESTDPTDHMSDTFVGVSDICDGSEHPMNTDSMETDGDYPNDDNLIPVPGGFEYISPNQNTGTSTSIDTDE